MGVADRPATANAPDAALRQRPLGRLAGCTDPTSNILHWNSYDSKLICNLSDPFIGLPALLTPSKPAVRDFQFFVTSDLHFYRIWYNIDDQIGHPARINAMAAAAAATGHPYAAVIVPGDLTTGADAARLGAYRSLWEPGILPGSSINLPVYVGLGNHDISAKGGGFGIERDGRKTHLGVSRQPDGGTAHRHQHHWLSA